MEQELKKQQKLTENLKKELEVRISKKTYRTIEKFIIDTLELEETKTNPDMVAAIAELVSALPKRF